MSNMDFTVGRWAVVPGYSGNARLNPNVMRIDAATDKQIRENGKYGASVKNKDDVLATFGSEDEARRLVQSIAGIRGEMERRQRAATDWAMKALVKKLENPA